jgi:hypothetical protein
LDYPEKASEFLKKLSEVGIEPKLRAYQPIIQSCCEIKKDHVKALQLFKELQSKQILPLSEHLMMLLVVSYHNNGFQEASFLSDICSMIDSLSLELLGFMLNEAKYVISNYRNLSIHSVSDEGILIDNIDVVKNDIIIDEDINDINRSIVALNSSYPVRQTFDDLCGYDETSVETLSRVGDIYAGSLFLLFNKIFFFRRSYLMFII